MNQDLSEAYRVSSTDNLVPRERKQDLEPREANASLGFSLLSLVTVAVFWGIALVAPSIEKWITPGMVFIACIPTGCVGVVLSVWTLLSRPGWKSVFGILAGSVAVAAGLLLAYLLCWARSPIV